MNERRPPLSELYAPERTGAENSPVDIWLSDVQKLLQQKESIPPRLADYTPPELDIDQARKLLGEYLNIFRLELRHRRIQVPVAWWRLMHSPREISEAYDMASPAHLVDFAKIARAVGVVKPQRSTDGTQFPPSRLRVLTYMDFAGLGLLWHTAVTYFPGTEIAGSEDIHILRQHAIRIAGEKSKLATYLREQVDLSDKYRLPHGIKPFVIPENRNMT